MLHSIPVMNANVIHDPLLRMQREVKCRYRGQSAPKRVPRKVHLARPRAKVLAEAAVQKLPYRPVGQPESVVHVLHHRELQPGSMRCGSCDQPGCGANHRLCGIVHHV
jgi:hypothetical protein